MLHKCVICHVTKRAMWVLDECQSCDDVVVCECHLTTMCPVSDICQSHDNNVSSEWHTSVTWQQCVMWVLDECHVTAMSSWKAHTHYIRTWLQYQYMLYQARLTGALSFHAPLHPPPPPMTTTTRLVITRHRQGYSFYAAQSLHAHIPSSCLS